MRIGLLDCGVNLISEGPILCLPELRQSWLNPGVNEQERGADPRWKYHQLMEQEIVNLTLLVLPSGPNCCMKDLDNLKGCQEMTGTISDCTEGIVLLQYPFFACSLEAQAPEDSLIRRRVWPKILASWSSEMGRCAAMEQNFGR
jgi:hypothetical protein